MMLDEHRTPRHFGLKQSTLHVIFQIKFSCTRS
jgi:hypothetical protein